jgi:hypothetical protein
MLRVRTPGVALREGRTAGLEACEPVGCINSICLQIGRSSRRDQFVHPTPRDVRLPSRLVTHRCPPDSRFARIVDRNRRHRRQTLPSPGECSSPCPSVLTSGRRRLTAACASTAWPTRHRRHRRREAGRAAALPPSGRTARRSRAGPGARRDPSGRVGASAPPATGPRGRPRIPLTGWIFGSVERRGWDSNPRARSRANGFPRLIRVTTQAASLAAFSSFPDPRFGLKGGSGAGRYGTERLVSAAVRMQRAPRSMPTIGW